MKVPIVPPFFSPMNARLNGRRETLAVLEGAPCGCRSLSGLGVQYPEDVPAAPAPVVPPGFTDWRSIADKTASALVMEPDAAKRALLQQGLTIAGTALAIPGLGVILAGVTALLAFIGITIKGKTQHVDTDTAAAAAHKWVDSYVIPLFQSLPVEARPAIFAALEDWDRKMYARYAGEWGGEIAQARQGVIPTAAYYASIPWSSFISYLGTGYNPLVSYLYTIIHSSDAENVNEQLAPAFFQYFTNEVLRPLDSFMLKTYNQTVAQYQAAGGKLGIASASLTTGGKVAVAAVAVGLLGALWRTAKRGIPAGGYR